MIFTRYRTLTLTGLMMRLTDAGDAESMARAAVIVRMSATTGATFACCRSHDHETVSKPARSSPRREWPAARAGRTTSRRPPGQVQRPVDERVPAPGGVGQHRRCHPDPGVDDHAVLHPDDQRFEGEFGVGKLLGETSDPYDGVADGHSGRRVSAVLVEQAASAWKATSISSASASDSGTRRVARSAVRSIAVPPTRL
jgi:hypothetical protein